MRIARPSRPDVPFKRKRRPPPQATKLLTYSLATGIAFMVLLGIVFLPRLFVEQPAVATPVEMTRNTTAGTRLVVTSVGVLVSLTKLQSAFFRDSVELARLGPPLGGGDATFAFTDADADARLSPGDFFTLTEGPTGCYRVEVLQIEDRGTFLVGRESWGGCPAT